jgi:hypothetical protein
MSPRGARATALFAEFPSADDALDAVRRLRARGYAALELYTPYPLEDADAALGLRRPWLSWVVIASAFVGAAVAYLIQWYANSWSYPLNVGGRPLHPIPAFIPITFETFVLFASFAAFVGVLVTARLFRYWRPEFEIPGFERATVDRYWVAVDARDPRFDRARTGTELLALGPLRVVGLETPA